jgi:hypothetical protein
VVQAAEAFAPIFTLSCFFYSSAPHSQRNVPKSVGKAGFISLECAIGGPVVRHRSRWLKVTAKKTFSSQDDWLTAIEKSLVESDNAASDQLRLGEYRIDYSMPTQAELDANDPELSELFTRSKIILVKHNP